MEELLQYYKEYIQFLSRANNGPINIAFMHGWVCPEEDIVEGDRLRSKIKELEKELLNKNGTKF